MSHRHRGSNLPTCLQADFTQADPKKFKKQSSHQHLFALLGSSHEKTVHKTLVKSTTWDRPGLASGHIGKIADFKISAMFLKTA